MWENSVQCTGWPRHKEAPVSAVPRLRNGERKQRGSVCIVGGFWSPSAPFTTSTTRSAGTEPLLGVTAVLVPVVCRGKADAVPGSSHCPVVEICNWFKSFSPDARMLAAPTALLALDYCL